MSGRGRFVAHKTPDSVLVQVITGQSLWARLTKPQRRLLAQHLTVVDESAKRPTERYAVRTDPVVAGRQTLVSLRAKGVLTDDDRITWDGAYALLWGCAKQLEEGVAECR